MKTAEIALTRLRKDASLLAFTCVASVCVALVQPRGIEPLQRLLTGAIVFGTLVGIVAAVMQRGAGRLREIELIEQSAPIFGRELARATAIVPCVIVVAAIMAYWAARLLAGGTMPPIFLGGATLAVVAATLVALSATLRRGGARYLYIVLACAVAAIAYVLLVAVERLGILAETAFCALIVFIALRQYGEALARYDPIPE